MSLQPYDPSQHVISIFGVNLGDFQDGTYIDVERAEDAFKSHTGSLGDKTVTRQLDKGGKITITLMAQGPSNDYLQSIMSLAEQFGLVRNQTLGTIQIKDLLGNMRVHAESGWIMKQPKIERGKESGSTVWVFEVADLEMVSGSNVQL